MAGPDDQHNDQDAAQQAAAGVDTPARTRPCRYCDATVEQPTKAGAVKDFCDARHRAAFRERERQQAIQEALDTMDQAADDMEQTAVKFRVALRKLERFLAKGKKRTEKT